MGGSIRRELAHAGLVSLIAASTTLAQAGQRTATITGSVYDSIGRTPLPGASIQLLDRSATGRMFSTTADSLGRFRIEGIPFGDYLAGFFHPAIDSLGIELRSRTVRIATEQERVDLGSPSPAQLLQALCGAQKPSDSTALVIGHVRQAETDQPIVGASVLLEWTESSFDRSRAIRTIDRSATAHSRQGGFFALCGVPAGFELTMRAAFGADTTGYIEHESSPKGVDHVSFYIGHAVRAFVTDVPVGGRPDTVRFLRGSARLLGRVVNKQGDPVANARVEVIGTGVAGTTNDVGRFAIDSLPSGTRSIGVRAIGYSPIESIIQLADDRPTTADLRLDERAVVLDAVQVRGTVAYSRKIQQFENHRRRGVSGMFFRPTVENGQSQWSIMTYVQQSPNGRIDYVRGDPVFTMRATNGHPGRCVPSIYVDAVRSMLDFSDLVMRYGPGDFLGIEIYYNHNGIPVEFTDPRNDACGAIALWTK